MKFTNYLSPSTTEEALEYAALPDTVILGGGMWVRMQKKTYENAVDLSGLGLDGIDNTANGLKIGAYVTLRQLETDPVVISYTKNAIQTALSPIVGVQFRNGATLGGSIYGRFGFSDVTALFCALDATLVFARAGAMKITDYVNAGAPHDILLYVILPKDAPDCAVTLAHRHSATDFPLATVSAVRRGEEITVTASPLPLRAVTKKMSISEASADAFMDGIQLKENAAEAVRYRDRVVRVLVSRAISAAGGKK